MTFNAQAFHALDALVLRIQELDENLGPGIDIDDPCVVEAVRVIEYLKSEGYESLHS